MSNKSNYGLNGYGGGAEALRTGNEAFSHPNAVWLRTDALKRGLDNLNRLDGRVAPVRQPDVVGAPMDMHEKFGPQVDAAMKQAATADSGIAQQHAAEVDELAARRAQRLSEENQHVADTVAISADGQLERLRDFVPEQAVPYEEAA